MLNSFRVVFIIAMAALLTINPLGRSACGPLGKPFSSLKRKKVIEWGWDEPTTAFLKENIDKVERMPFDGVVFPLRLRDGANVTWKMWGATKFEYSDLAYMVEDLKQTPFKSLTDRFIRANVTPGNVDWFDDQAWSIVLHNFALAAKVAKDGNCKGFMFDAEQYEGKLFDLTFATAMHMAAPEQYRVKIRQRGREFITAIAREFPDIIILLPWAYHAYDKNKQSYALLPAFLDGIFEAAPQTLRLVDAGESAYEAKTQKDFQWLHSKLAQDMRRYSAVPELYKAKVEVAFGIWIDAEWNKVGWHQDDLTKNFFNPSEFGKSVAYALESTDEYVWIYSEKPNWWTGANLPPAYVQALATARARN
ncbi:MAG: hypothetical protein WCC40_00280 [Rhodomicrobium sp.]